MSRASHIFNRLATEIFSGILQPMRCSAWCAKHYRLSPESSSVEGPFHPVKYQADILDVFGMEGGPDRIAWMKSARVGYTAALTGAICYFAAHARRHVILYMPNDADARAISKDTISPALRDCAPTNKMLEAVEDKRADNTALYRNMQGKTLRVTGAVSPSRFRRTSADVSFLDEADGYPEDVGGEGDAVSLAWRAVRISPFRRQIIGSTPSDETTSMVYREYKNAQMRFVFVVPCPHCDTLIDLRWEQMRFLPASEDDGDIDTIEARAESTNYESQCCGGTWHHGLLEKLLPRGRWQTVDGSHHIHVGEGQPRLLTGDGVEARWPNRIAFHIWAAYSVFEDWASIVREFLSAEHNATMLKAWTNHYHGKPWKDETTSVSEDDLLARQAPANILPAAAKIIIVAVDVQQSWLSVLTVAWGPRLEMWILSRTEFHGATDTVEGIAWRDFNAWLATRPVWQREDGEQLPIDMVVVDSGHQANTVYQMSKRLRAERVMIVKGANDWQAPVVKVPPTAWRSTDGKTGVLFMVGVNQAKRTIVRLLANPRQAHLSDGLPPEVAQELAAEELVTKKIKGRPVLEWRQIRARNEALDCAVYALCGLTLRNPPWANPAATGEAPPQPAATEEAPPAPRKAPPRRTRSTRSRGGKRRTSGRRW